MKCYVSLSRVGWAQILTPCAKSEKLAPVVEPSARRGTLGPLLDVTLIACILLISANAWGKPVVEMASLTFEQVLAPSNMLVINGHGFGSKKQAAPILFDRVSHAWENGIRNDVHSLVEDMDPISGVWARKTSPESAGVNSGMRIAKSRPLRHSSSSAHYYAAGNKNTLGWPYANGGTNPPAEGRKMYAAWWGKSSFDLRYYWAIPGDANSFNFLGAGLGEYGESLEVMGTSIVGKLIAHDTEVGGANGWLFMEFPVGTKLASLGGRTIRGTSTGTEVLFPNTNSPAGFDEAGYINPRGKWARFWDVENGMGFRFSLGNVSTSGGTVNLYYNTPGSPTPQEWNFWEILLDVGVSPHVSIRLNGEEVVSGTTAWSEEMAGRATKMPTIAALGLDDFMPRPFTIELDDIYLDGSFQRVVLANAATLADATAFELQRPLAWNASTIEAEFNLGAIDSDEPIYVFVFDENGVSNAQGTLLCEKCASPSEPPPYVGVQ